MAAAICSADELAQHAKLCGMPVKMEGEEIDMDDIEMEPLTPRAQQNFQVLYTADVDLSETGGTVDHSEFDSALTAPPTTGGWR
jgi:hypothetical protein